MIWFARFRRRRDDNLLQAPRDDDDDDAEGRMLSSFEADVEMLDTLQYTGVRRLQVDIWLFFEDATSSRLAAESA